MDGAAHQGVLRLFCTHVLWTSYWHTVQIVSIEEYAPFQSQTCIQSRPRCFVSGKNSPVCAVCVCVNRLHLDEICALSVSYFLEIKANSCFWFCKQSKYICDLFKWHSSTMGWLLQSAVLGFMYVCIVFCCCYFCILSGPGSSAKLARAVKDRQSPTHHSGAG